MAWLEMKDGGLINSDIIARIRERRDGRTFAVIREEDRWLSDDDPECSSRVYHVELARPFGVVKKALLARRRLHKT